MLSSEIENSSPTAQPYNCLDCGACCGCYPIFASASDAEKEPQIIENGILEKNFLGKNQRAYRLYPVPRFKACPFIAADNCCRIYETRPEICRRFEVGSDQCIEARRRKGIN